MEEQHIVPNFAAYKIGKALLILGKHGKKAAYADKAFDFKQSEVEEALQLVAGAEGSENVECFSTALQHTSLRLAD